MQATQPMGWGPIAQEVALLLGLPTHRSPTLARAIELGVRFMSVDHSRQQLVFDARALFLGLLAAGRQDRDSISYGNTASWFSAWVSETVGPKRMIEAISDRAMTPPEEVFGGAFSSRKIALSIQVTGLLAPAQAFADQTIGRVTYEARHLFAAMITMGVVTEQLRSLFKYELTPDKLQDLQAFFVERVMGSPDLGETHDRWRAVFGLDETDDSSGVDAKPPRAVEHIVPFNRDRGAGGDDPLSTAADARALARLICLREAAPLALAIFGGWGSGKSTFMERIDHEVRVIADASARRTVEKAAETENPFIGKVVQIRFNAWQFVDANLWASLTAEFFDQLRAGGWDRVEGARHADLVERVNRHVHALTTDAEAHRAAASAGGKEVVQAQKARDEAAKVARDAPGKSLGQAGVDLLGDLYENQRSNLAALGWIAAGVDTREAVGALVDAASTSHKIWGQVASVFRFLSKSRTKLICVVSLVVLALATGAVMWRGLSWTGLVAVFVALGSLGSVAATIAPALKLVGAISARAADIVGAADKSQAEATKTLVLKEVELRNATAEAAALQKAADRAATALARYVDPKARSNPPRLLRYVLEDNPDTQALTAEIGLIGRTRRLFQAVDDIVREERKKPADERLDHVPDRIVLYIDDLDRCTPEQVYAVLQAIHLLLAFELFVVVVGVDVKWVEDALAKQLGEKAGEPNGVDLRQQRPMRYLEKIFQIAFWLGPLSRGDDGSFGRYVRGLAESSVASDSDLGPGVPSSPDGPRPNEQAVDVAGTSAVGGPKPATPEGGPVVETQEDLSELAETMRLEPLEITFLGSDIVGAIAASTPRGVKRLVNVYRLVRSRLSERGDPIMGDAARPPAYPLIAIAVALETGERLAAAEYFHRALSALPGSESLNQSVFSALPPMGAGSEEKDMAKAMTLCPGLKGAITEAVARRKGGLTVGDMLDVIEIARRYSFHSAA
jgi:hypothetical protein